MLDADHPSTSHLPPTWHIRDDECYYLKQLNPDIHVLLAADLTTVEDEEGKTDYPADTFGDYFPPAGTILLTVAGSGTPPGPPQRAVR